jgi:3',5'-cyclic AMP phosphodiesterase CpdA
MSGEFRIIHLSDLHFVENLKTEGTSFGRGRFLTNSHKYRFYTHLVDSLEATIGSATPADVCIATGDISTDGSAAGLATALNGSGARGQRPAQRWSGSRRTRSATTFGTGWCFRATMIASKPGGRSRCGAANWSRRSARRAAIRI